VVVVVIFEGFRYGVSWSCLKLPKQATSDFLPVQHERENTGVDSMRVFVWSQLTNMNIQIYSLIVVVNI